MDSRLEARLRNDPTLDPRHVPGRFRDRTAAAAVRRPGPRATVVVARPVGALLGVAVILATTLMVRTVLDPGAPEPTPTPSASPPEAARPTMDAGRVPQVLDGWVDRFGAAPPPMSVTVVGPGGIKTRWTAGLPRDEVATVRIGEISRLYLSAGLVIIDACSRVTSQWSCPRPAVFGVGLALGDPVARWYEPWPDDDQTTVGQLLEGSSGLAATATSVSDLAEQIAADPGRGWSRDAVIGRAIAAPRAFPAGSQRSSTDTEGFVLEELLESATQLSSDQIIPTDNEPPFFTRFHDQVNPDGLIVGEQLSGEPVPDLDPAVLALVGNAGGMTASSDDLAEYPFSVWATEFSLQRETLDYLTDASRGHANPIAARGICCRDGEITTIASTGHAYGWSALIAYDFKSGISIGAVVGRDLSEEELASLLEAVLDEATGVLSG